MRRLLPFLALAALACSSSHTGVDPDAGPTPSDGGGGCGGPIPLCYPGWGGFADCCLEPGSPATCSGGSWSCPSGAFLADDCGRVDSICEGFDAGMPPILYDDCTRNSDCVLVADSCCGTCGRPTRGDVAAVNESRTEDYYLDVACPEARDEPPICPGCASQPNPYLVATCDMMPFRPVCSVVDLETPEYQSCTTDSDCVLAAPDCCACGEIDLFSTLAVRGDVDVNALLCDGEIICPPCAAVFDPRATPRCDAGACVVDVAP
ncbi:MAG: hypothetical protein R3B82_02770 [Sandaracinaceae bacterium]